MKTYTAEVFSKDIYSLGESPAYDTDTGILSWVDIDDGALYLKYPNGREEQYFFNQSIGTAVPAADGGYAVAGQRGLYLWKDGVITELRSLGGVLASYQRSNDAKADPKGRFWFGSTVCDGVHEDCGNLFCLDRGELKVMQENTKLSNGMAWNSAKNRFFFSDTTGGGVYAYDYDGETGKISNRELLFSVDNGLSDGMCIDSQDGLWVAVWGGGKIEHRSSVTGEKLGEISVDAKNVTSCCFFGENMDTLLITTSGSGQHGAHDGCLFTCKVDVKGVPTDKAVL